MRYSRFLGVAVSVAALYLTGCYSIDTITMDNVNQSLKITTDNNVILLNKEASGFFTGIDLKMTHFPNCGTTKLYAKPLNLQSGSVVVLSKDMFDSKGDRLYVSVQDLSSDFQGQHYIDFRAVNICEESHFITSVRIGRLK